MNLKISHKLRFISLFVKRFKRLKINFWYKATVELVKAPFWYLFKLVQAVGALKRGLEPPYELWSNWFKSNHLQIFYKRGVLENFPGIFLWILCNFSKSDKKVSSVNRTWEIFFFKNQAENELRGLVSDLFL